MLNDTCSNLTSEFENDSSVNSFYVKLFVFTGMLISVIFIPTHLFLLYVTDNVETAKGKNFMSLMLMLLIKYLFILLNTTLGIPQLANLSNVMIFALIYVHLSATCWLCIITEHSLNIIKKTIWKTYNVRWISISVSSIFGWILPIFFVLLAFLFSVAALDQFCDHRCNPESCQARIFYTVFELITLILLIKSSVDIIRVKYYTLYTRPSETNVETVVSDLDYINFGLMFCMVFYTSWILGIISYLFETDSVISVISVVSSIEAILIVLGTLWWKKCISSESASRNVQ